MQNQQFELDLLNERGQEILQLADANNKKAIESQLSEITSEWHELISGFEGRRNALDALSQHWEDLETQWALIETRLTAIEEKNKLIDTVIRSKQHLNDTVKALEVSNALPIINYNFSVLIIIKIVLRQKSPANLNLFLIRIIKDTEMSCSIVIIYLQKYKTGRNNVTQGIFLIL